MSPNIGWHKVGFNPISFPSIILCQPEWWLVIMEGLCEGKNMLAGGTDGDKENNAGKKQQLAYAEV